jgi:tetratricopeptide (TPR) repeat protein
MQLKLPSFILILLFLSPGIFGQSINAFKSVKIDTTRKISSDEVIKIANRFLIRSNKNISDANEKNFIDQQLGKVESKDRDKLKIAQGLSSTAILFTGTGQSENTSVIFSAKAVTLFPKDTMIVNNFGAVLRMLDSVETSLPVLLYARQLYPVAPVILTNLGNTLFELYDDKSAENFYKKALKVNPDYALARHGLVSVYLKRRDIRQAMEQLFKGISGIYSESLADVKDKAKNNKSISPPAPKIEEPKQDSGDNQGQNQGSGSPNPNVPVDNLVLPDFPNWSEIAALLNDKSIEKINKKLTQINSGNPAFSKAMERSKMTPDQQQSWYENETRPGRIKFKRNEAEMDLMEEYFDDQLNAAHRNYMRSDSLNIVRFTKMFKQAASADEARSKQMAADPEAWQAYLIERCNTYTQINNKSFNDWKKVASERHKKYEDILMTYWISCEQYLNRTYDLNEFEILNSKRKSFVASNFGLIYTDYSFRKFQFAFSNIASCASAAGNCPQAPPPPEPAESNEDKVKVPDKEAIPCPFKKNKLKIGLGVCSVGLDCENVEAECGEGLIAGAKWNYKKKEMTLFGGAGLKADFGVKGYASASAGAKAGFELTFNDKSQVIDGGFKTKVGAKASLGEFTAGQSGEFKITAATGIDIKRTNDLSTKVF